MEVLSIKPENNVFLNIGDGNVENSIDTIEKIVKQIREFKPDIIITHNPENVVIRFDKDINWINHRDHMNTGLVSTYAAYPYSRDTLFFPEHFQNSNLKSHTVSEFLYVDYYDHIDEVFIDVTQHIDTKVKAIAAHSSQYSVENAQESADFFTTIKGNKNRFERFRYVIAD
jgi:LmbE family N-acetylglucosaminyl deacetylase